MSNKNYQEVIKNNKLFDGIPPQNLNFEFRNEQILKKKEGEIIFQKGDESKNTYLLIAGRVKIKVYIENKSVKINKSINDFFGEIEVIEDTYRRSAAVANTDCILYTLTKNDLGKFIEHYPAINDNIIAYNKVEIPELQISINQRLLKEDTDKLYLTPPHKDKIADESPGTSFNTDEEIIYNNDKTSNETFKEESKADVLLDEEVFDENSYSTNEKETTEPIEKASDAGLNDDIDQREKESEPNADSSGGTVLTDSAEMSDSEENQVIDNNEKEETYGKEFSEIEDVPDQDFPDTSHDEIEEEENIESDGEITSENSDNMMSEVEESVEEVISSIEAETEEEILLSENASDSLSSESENRDEKDSEWLDLNSQDEDIEFKDSASGEEENIRYEVEDQKLKYDDTEVNSIRILEAVKKINSSFDKHTVYLNIVNESVKLTEAQAGKLYRVDLSKKILITEEETEKGFKEVSYSLSNGLTGLAAETGEMINIREPLKDFRYSEEIDSIRGIVSSSMLYVPVKFEDGDTIAVLCLANSSSGKFSISDEEKISWLIPHIAQTLQFINGIGKLIDEDKDVYLSTLTRFITDNIQTPVLTMKYYAGQIKKKNVPLDVRTVLNVLMDQADSVVDFLHSTLSFTEKRNPLQIEKCNLRDVMDDALGLLAEYVESRNVGLYKKVDNKITVKLDKKAFYQACQQIARNACDAMGESGNIYITAKQSGDLVDIEFRDTGPGIPDDIKDEIFQPFKSFNKENGTGLGLTIARKIIRDHGGELTVESNPEEGATFVISLPVFDDI